MTSISGRKMEILVCRSKISKIKFNIQKISPSKTSKILSIKRENGKKEENKRNWKDLVADFS